jgi:hypothetical protein
MNEQAGFIRVQRSGRGIVGLDKLIARLPSGIVMAEIGCYAGESSAQFLRSGKITRFFAIDPWLSGYDENDASSASDMSEVESRFDIATAGYDVIKLKGDIDNAIAHLPVLDFVYIDGNHRYDHVKNDILKSLTRVKPDGIIAGHDYPCGSVRRAVIATLGEPGYTFEDDSWLIHLGAQSR